MVAFNTKINYKIFDAFPSLESERLIFRQPTFKDAKDVLDIRSNIEVMEYMDSDGLKSISDAEDLIQKNTNLFEEKRGIIWMIIDKSSLKVIGDFAFWRLIPDQCRAEIGYTLKPQFWGKGLMSETMNKIIPFGFNELSLHSLEANVNPKNMASKNLLEKIGFQKEAYFRENYLYKGQFLDSEIYALLETDI